MRTPISRVRWRTLYEITPKIPTEASSSAVPPNAVSTAERNRGCETVSCITCSQRRNVVDGLVRLEVVNDSSNRRCSASADRSFVRTNMFSFWRGARLSGMYTAVPLSWLSPSLRTSPTTPITFEFVFGALAQV